MEVIGFFISSAIMSLIMFVLHSLKSRKARFTYNRFVLRYPIAIRLLFFVALLVFSLGPIYLSKLHPEKGIEEYLIFLPVILITLLGFLEAQNERIYYSQDGIASSSFFGRKKEANWEDLELISFSTLWSQYVLHFSSGVKIRVNKQLSGIDEFLALIQTGTNQSLLDNA